MNLYRVGSDNKASNALPVDEATLESRLEDILELNPDLVLGRKLLVIGRQILTDTGKRLDLVALDASGRIVVAELKRGYAPREVIAQVIDYAVWLDGLSDKQLEAIYRGYASDHSGGAKSLHQAFEQRFETTFERNADDQVLLVLFAKEFPPEVSRAATFLSERGVSLLCISFEMFKAEQGESMLVTREIAGTVETEGSAEEALPTKRTDRRYMQGIADTIEDALAEPFDSFQNKRLIHMKTYQQKDGSFTSAYTDWEYGSSKLTYEIQLCRTSPSEGIFIMIWARSPSELYTKKIQSSRVKASMRELGYKIDAPDGEEPYFMCTVTKDISELNDELGKRILNHTKKAGILALKIFME